MTQFRKLKQNSNSLKSVPERSISWKSENTELDEKIHVFLPKLTPTKLLGDNNPMISSLFESSKSLSPKSIDNLLNGLNERIIIFNRKFDMTYNNITQE